MKGGFGSFLLKKTAAKSIRQKYSTGPQYDKRKFFHFKKGRHVLERRIGAVQHSSPHMQAESRWFSHLPGDVRQRPTEDFTFEDRQDKAQFAWKKRGNLQVFQIGGKTETFVCFRCGYPVKSKLQVIKSDNWDWKMCYACYISVVNMGQEGDI